MTGKILHRAEPGRQRATTRYLFQGEITATECGPKHEFELTDDDTKQIVAVAATAQHRQRHRRQDLRPERRAARRRRPRHQPRGRDLHRRLDPGGHLLGAGLPVRRPDRAVRRRRATTPPRVTTQRHRRARRRRRWRSTPKWRYFTANPTLDYVGRPTTPTNSVVGCWIPGAGLHRADRAAPQRRRARPVGHQRRDRRRRR